MKHLFFTILAVATLSITSCKKCYECSTDLPITVDGQVVGTTPYSSEECGRGSGIKQKIDGLEGEGYTCTQK